MKPKIVCPRNWSNVSRQSTLASKVDCESLDLRLERLVASEQLVPARIAPGDDLPVGPRIARGVVKPSGALNRFLAGRDD